LDVFAAILGRYLRLHGILFDLPYAVVKPATWHVASPSAGPMLGESRNDDRHQPSLRTYPP
jgi:hypothetical protein